MTSVLSAQRKKGLYLLFVVYIDDSPRTRITAYCCVETVFSRQHLSVGQPRSIAWLHHALRFAVSSSSAPPSSSVAQHQSMCFALRLSGWVAPPSNPALSNIKLLHCIPHACYCYRACAVMGLPVALMLDSLVTSRYAIITRQILTTSQHHTRRRVGTLHRMMSASRATEIPSRQQNTDLFWPTTAN